MPYLSQRGLHMPASPIRKLIPLADAAKARGTRVFHLNIGQPDLPTPPAFFDAVRKTGGTLEYSHSAGILSYRQALARYYDRFDMNVTAEHILITNGGSEAVLFALLACLNPGDEILVQEPFYANYLGFANAAGVEVKPLPSSVESGFALPSSVEIETALGPRTRAILLNNPANPTGKLYTDDELGRLAALVRKHDLYLLADEVYKEFCYDGLRFSSVLARPDLSDHAIVIDSISKRYSACGARVGALITRNGEVYGAALKYAQARLSPPTLGQVGAQALCALPDSYYDSVRAEYEHRRNVLLEGLAQIPGVFCPHVSGAFYVMPRLPIDDSDRFCAWLLKEFQHNGATVMLAPGKGFYASQGSGRQEVRLAYVLKEADLRTAMELLRVALGQYPGRQEGQGR